MNKQEQIEEALRTINNANISLNEGFVRRAAAVIFANQDIYSNPQTSVQVKVEGYDPTEVCIVLNNVLVIPSDRGTLVINAGNNTSGKSLKEGDNNERTS